MASTEPAQAATPDTTGGPLVGEARLRAEHEALASRLEARASILEIRRASIALFAGLLGVGFTGKMGWDRWGIPRPGDVPTGQHGPPYHIYLAMAATIVVLILSVGWFLRARRLLADEERLFARFKEVRAALRYDA